MNPTTTHPNPPPGTDAGPPRPQPPGGRPLEVLHLEDDPDDAVFVLRELEDQDTLPVHITTVERLSDGLRRLRAQRFDLALLDLSLPDSQGLPTFEQLRREAPDLPIVVLADTTDADFEVPILRQGAQDFLRKRQISPDWLRSAIRFAVERHRVAAEFSLRTRALVEGESRVRRIIEANADAVVIVDAEGNVRFANPAAEKLFGRVVSDLVGRPFGFPAVTGKTTELDILRPDGSTGVAEMRVVETEWGEQPAFLASLRDITERKRLEAKLLRAQRMESIGALAGGIAHDLNNVLAPIIMSVDILRQKVVDPEGVTVLQTLSESALRGADMVRQVLTFARGIDGQRIAISARSLMNDVAKIFNDTFLKSVDVSTSVAPDVWTVIGDRTQLHQVFINLGVNARDAMPNGGELMLTAANVVLDEKEAAISPEAKAGPYVVFTVADSGIGIPHEIIDQIFDPFFTTKEVGKGSGLGLATVRGIVKSHEGFITVYSEIGRGTTFRVYLPAKRVRTEENASLAAANLPRGRSEWVLVVDDEASIRQITQYTLEAFGYRVLVARDGPEALAVYAQRASDIAVVLTDMMMPNLDGFATMRALRSMNPNLKIIAASGLATDGQSHAAERAGCDFFLAKPYTAEALLGALHRVLRDHASHSTPRLTA